MLLIVMRARPSVEVTFERNFVNYICLCFQWALTRIHSRTSNRERLKLNICEETKITNLLQIEKMREMIQKQEEERELKYGSQRW